MTKVITLDFAPPSKPETYSERDLPPALLSNKERNLAMKLKIEHPYEENTGLTPLSDHVEFVICDHDALEREIDCVIKARVEEARSPDVNFVIGPEFEQDARLKALVESASKKKENELKTYQLIKALFVERRQLLKPNIA